MAQWVKDLALLLLWLGFDPSPGEFLHTSGMAKKKKRKIVIPVMAQLLTNPTRIHEDVGSP